MDFGTERAKWVCHQSEYALLPEGSLWPENAAVFMVQLQTQLNTAKPSETRGADRGSSGVNRGIRRRVVLSRGYG